MSRNYKFHNKEGLYFVSFAVVYWIDVFVRELYCEKITESLNFCQKEKSMQIYAWCIMPSHIHLIFKAKNNNPSDLIRDFKRHTSKEIQKAIENNIHESRIKWLLWMMEQAGKKNSNVKKRQFWQQHNKPIELWSNEVIQQKIDYIHNNPVVSGFVVNACDWKYSSARNYAGEVGELKINVL